jgi:hypothetical protein
MRYGKAVLAISLLLIVSACGHVHPADVAWAPNPPPPPGYRAVCSSTPLPFNGFITNCTPTAAERTAVVRAKG